MECAKSHRKGTRHAGKNRLIEKHEKTRNHYADAVAGCKARPLTAHLQGEAHPGHHRRGRLRRGGQGHDDQPPDRAARPTRL